MWLEQCIFCGILCYSLSLPKRQSQCCFQWHSSLSPISPFLFAATSVRHSQLSNRTATTIWRTTAPRSTWTHRTRISPVHRKACHRCWRCPALLTFPTSVGSGALPSSRDARTGEGRVARCVTEWYRSVTWTWTCLWCRPSLFVAGTITKFCLNCSLCLHFALPFVWNRLISFILRFPCVFVFVCTFVYNLCVCVCMYLCFIVCIQCYISHILGTQLPIASSQM